ncbi:MAG: serine/threonine protein kinase [Pyrinomonadaceae bacterium]
MLETGKILQDRYRIDRQIGQGGMGSVYVATDLRFGSTVAVKETLCMDDNYRKALEREARLLNSLKHPALPRVSDHFLEDERQFIVMEYIPGEDLSCMMDTKGTAFSFSSVSEWADQLLDALDFLHNQSMPVIHRDIKPQNLKIMPDGRIALLDFGLAKGNPTDAGHQTAAKSIFGYSRNYASLEQIQGTGTDPRSDLYSLAATLYHLVTGRAPEDALTRAMSVLSKNPDPLVPANLLNSDIPPGFSVVLNKALDLNAAARPGSANEMRQMLKDHRSYEHLAQSGLPQPVHGGVDISSHQTKLMPGVTVPKDGGLSSAKTEILPGNDSVVTSIRPEGTRGLHSATRAADGGTRSSKRFGLAAAAAVLLVAGAAGAAYVFAPSLFNNGETAAPVEQSIVPEQDPRTEEAAVAEDAVGSEPALAPEQPKAQPERDVADKPQDKQPAKPTRNRTNDGLDIDAGDLVIEEDLPGGRTIYVANMKIANGVVEMPGNFTFKNDRKTVRPGPQAVPPIDPKYLTPRQRRQLEELRRRGLIGPPVPPKEKTKP